MKMHREDRAIMMDLQSKMTTLTNNVLKREKQHELDIAIAEAEITKYLPFCRTGREVDYFFRNHVTTRVITDYIWSAIERSGHTDPDIPTIVRIAARACFASELRAHLYVTEGDGKT